jgi:hypothetical protein
LSLGDGFQIAALITPNGSRAGVTRRRRDGAMVQEQRLYEYGVETLGNSVEESEAFILDEIVKWSKVIKESGIRVEN